MSTLHIEAGAVIAARADAIYAVLRDYRVGHPTILPKPEFETLTLEKGGEGTGTEYTLRVRLFGQLYIYQHRVEETRPGYELAEIDRETGQRVSWFTLEPRGDGRETLVTIHSDMPVAPGLQGLMQRLMQPSIVRRLYQRELANLAAYVREA